VYNAEKYLDRCMASILRQTYPNFEIILVDDGSTDDTPRLIKLLASKDCRIRCVVQANGGPSSARNAGLDEAAGEYTMFVDADDEVDATIIHKLLQPLAPPASDVDWVGCGYVWSEGATRRYINPFLRGNATTLSAKSLIAHALSGLGGLVGGKLFRTKLIKQIGLHFDTSLKMCEDLVFHVAYALHCRSATVVREHLYVYNQDNAQSICRSTRNDAFSNLTTVSNKLLRILLEGGFDPQAAHTLIATRRITEAIDLSLKQTRRLLAQGPRACAEQLHLIMSEPALKRDLALLNHAGIKTRIMAIGMKTQSSWVFLGLCVARLLAQRVKHVVLHPDKTQIAT
jgi:hypothetical protein